METTHFIEENGIALAVDLLKQLNYVNQVGEIDINRLMEIKDSTSKLLDPYSLWNYSRNLSLKKTPFDHYFNSYKTCFFIK